MGTIDLRQFTSADELARAASRDWVQEVSAVNSKKGAFCVALSGGRIAKGFFSAVSEQARAVRVSLTSVHFFWSDERCVAPDDPESNFRLAQESLFAPLNIPASQIHRVQGEKPPEVAVATAEAELRKVVLDIVEDQPVLDLVLLGMGEDGHVASLFPGEPEEVVSSKAVFRCVKAVKPPPLRITFGYPAIAAARQVWVLASGGGKEKALRESLEANGRTPLARVLKLRRLTRIYSDMTKLPN